MPLNRPVPVKRVPPAEAAALVAQGWTYVDVRSEQEFADGHPPGAYNVPFMFFGPGGRSVNEDFVSVVERSFGRDRQLVLGCSTVRRSARAADLLAEAGFEQLVVMSGGLTGEEDSLGRVVVEGWTAHDLPMSTVAEAGHLYQDIVQRGVK